MKLLFNLHLETDTILIMWNKISIYISSYENDGSYVNNIRNLLRLFNLCLLIDLFNLWENVFGLQGIHLINNMLVFYPEDVGNIQQSINKMQSYTKLLHS